MITNEQIEMLKTVRSGWAGEWAECCAIDTAIDTLDKLPTYADTGARFVPNRDECWIVIDNGVGEPDDDTPRYVVVPGDAAFSDNKWAPPGDLEQAYWTGKWYSTEAAAERAAKEAKP